MSPGLLIRKGRSMKKIMVFFMLLLSILVAHNADAITEEKETPHYDVVVEYIRSLGAIHSIQQSALKQQQGEKDVDNMAKKMMDSIRTFTRLKLELNTSIKILEGMTLKEPFDELIPQTIYLYRQKIKLFDEINQISKLFIDKIPKPGVDFSVIHSRMPEITAGVDYIDANIFRLMDLVFGLLIDDKPDAEGHMSHLNITTAQRQRLISNIDVLFGESLNQKEQNWTIMSAALLKAYLQKDYTCIDGCLTAMM